MLVEKIHYLKICRKSTLSSPPVFFSEATPPNLFSKLAALKFCKIPLDNPQWISVVVAGHGPSCLLNCGWSILSLELWSSYLLNYLSLIAIIKSSQQKCSLRNVLQYSQENTFVGALSHATSLKRDSNTGLFLWISGKV